VYNGEASSPWKVIFAFAICTSSSARARSTALLLFGKSVEAPASIEAASGEVGRLSWYANRLRASFSVGWKPMPQTHSCPVVHV
jgi:hypothetical protein